MKKANLLLSAMVLILIAGCAGMGSSGGSARWSASGSSDQDKLYRPGA